MKKIVDGKRYDTETAEEIAYYSNDLYTTDFGWYEETLYRTKNGNWFIAGEGGAMTGYSRPCENNGSCGGSDIRPLTNNEAKEWLEGNDEIEALETHFTIVDA